MSQKLSKEGDKRKKEKNFIVKIFDNDCYGQMSGSQQCKKLLTRIKRQTFFLLAPFLILSSISAVVV